jgi:hypothetical protein
VRFVQGKAKEITMTDENRNANKPTTGGALNIPDDNTGRVGSDAELKGASPSKPDAAEAASGDPAAPVDKFDPPTAQDDRRIFQNGDTDRQ